MKVKVDKDVGTMVLRKKYYPFSVLMTVYYKEAPHNLDSALKSIENQTILPDEVVLVEDGKLGNDLESVVLKYNQNSKCNFKVVRLKQNMGRGYASQVGLSYVTNKWVARMDSDDISVKNRFELQIKAIMKDRAINVVGGQVQEFEENVVNTKGQRKVPLSYEKIKEYAKYRSPLNNPTVMFNKEAVNAVGGFSHINVMEDYDLCVKLLSHNYKMINLNNILVYMRVSKKMYSRRGGLKYLNQYIKKKREWRKMGIGNIKTEFFSDLIMTANIFLPVSVRRVIYQKVLHKR